MTALNPEPAASDDALITAWRGGDERAATTLVQRHAGSLGRYLFGLGAPRSEIDDLVQETFIRAFRSLDRWRGEASFRSWLFRIGGNLGRDLYRREGRRVVLTISDADLRDPADPQAEVEAADVQDRLRSGIGRLTRMQREVFVLRAQQGMDYEEIATALETSAGAARVHYHHAVKRLKELLV
jgi:RNA polymerase sigma-70 factor, ECF subfamily